MTWTKTDSEDKDNRARFENGRVGEFIKNMETVIAFLEKEKARHEADMVKVIAESQKIIEQRKAREDGK